MSTNISKRFLYLKRVFKTYLFSCNSNLTFWHEKPAENPEASVSEIGQYFMTFEDKAVYSGPFDQKGIPLLDYHGEIGRQHYSIAISQYALGNYNLFKKTGKSVYLHKFLANAKWLLDNMTASSQGSYFWFHDFDWHYFRTLKAPWFSGLAQGQGLSVMVRTFAETQDPKYLEAAGRIYKTLTLPIDKGGVTCRDESGSLWIEEYIVHPPTHVLNGFIWSLWGLYDYHLVTKNEEALKLFETFTDTIVKNLSRYDSGFWSYYELTPQRIKCIASPFYHRLHIVQLRVMHRITGHPDFLLYAEKWSRYLDNPLYCSVAFAYKVLFKLAYY